MKKFYGVPLLIVILMSSIVITQAATEYNELPLEDTDYLLENEYIWYRFWFTKEQRIEVTLDVPSTADFDLYIQSDNVLDDDNGDGYLNDEGEPDLLAESSSFTQGENERIDWECPSTGEFFVIVLAYYGDGTYTLRVREEAGSPSIGLLIGIAVGVVIIILIGIVIILRTRKGREETQVPPPPISSKAPVEGVIYCPVCGSKNTSDSIFCASCGAELS